MNNRSRLWLSIGIPIFFIILVSLLYVWQSGRFAAQPQPLQKVRLAMDWTPNTNHTGIYVAQSKGWYKEAGIELELLPYSASVTPDVLVSTNKADVGISSTEGVVADRAAGLQVVSIAAVVQHNTSSLAVLSKSGIQRPRDLDGKKYGGFGAPYEEAVVSEIIKQDGGKGNIQKVVLDIDPLQALESGQVDFVWIFEAAQGIQAKRQNIQLTTFPITKYGIADYHTPTLITNSSAISKQKELLQRFLQATAKGYEFARQNANEAAAELIKQAPKGTFPDEEYVRESQQYLSPKYADNNRKWGTQDESAWNGYAQFMLAAGGVQDANGKIVRDIQGPLYTNELLK